MFELKLSDKLKKVPEGSLWLNLISNYGRFFSNIILPILLIPIVSRYLSISEFGQLNYVMTLISISILVTNMGIPIYAINIVGRECKYDEKERLISEIFSVRIFMVFLFFLIFLIFNFFFLDIELGFWVVIFVSVLADVFLFEWLYIAEKRQVVSFVRAFISKIVFFVLVVVFVGRYDGVSTYLYAFVFVNLVLSMFSFKYCFDEIVFSNRKMNRIDLKKIFKSIGLIFFITLLSSFFGKFDVIILERLLSEGEFGLFISAYKLLFIGVTLITSVSIMLIPYLDSKDDINRNSKIISQILYVSLVAYFFCRHFSETIIVVFYGEKYSLASRLLHDLSVIFLFLPFYNAVIYQVFVKAENYMLVIVLFVLSLIFGFWLYFFGVNFVQVIVSTNFMLFVCFFVVYTRLGYRVVDYSGAIVFTVANLFLLQFDFNFVVYVMLYLATSLAFVFYNVMTFMKGEND